MCTEGNRTEIHRYHDLPKDEAGLRQLVEEIEQIVRHCIVPPNPNATVAMRGHMFVVHDGPMYEKWKGDSRCAAGLHAIGEKLGYRPAEAVTHVSTPTEDSKITLRVMHDP